MAVDGAYNVVRDARPPIQQGGVPEVLPCPAGEPVAVEQQWAALAATCDGVTAGDVVVLLELARTLADVEEARRRVAEGGAFVLVKSGDMVENPWAVRERALRGQALQLRKSLDCLDRRVVSHDFAAQAEAKAQAAVEEAEAAKAKRAEAAAKRKAKREAAT